MLKIEKLWSGMLPSVPQKRKQTSEGIEATADKTEDQQPQNPYQDQQRPSRKAVEEAIESLKSTQEITEAGISIEMLETQAGLSVKLTQSNGTTIRTMSAEDFLKLRQGSNDRSANRGKILDQKF